MSIDPPVTHVLFDMDGLLLDTEAVYTKVTNDIVSRYGKTYDWDLKSKMMGMKERDAGELLVRTLGIPMTVDEYLAERNAGHEALFPHCRPLPGVMKLVSHLKKHNIPIAVATSSHRSAFELKSSLNGELFGLFDGHITCGDDPSIKHGKPAPDLFLAAAKALGNPLVDPRSCLVFEDSNPGVLAGLNAGMSVVWIPDPNLKTDDPTLGERVSDVLGSMEEFQPEKYGLPPYE
ncbi:HAD-like domain-containing protein [Polychytrium aggregatum]|uniref:HAD-like domain-containing protein n=1 Tax=Polychytrium aggregatum TaxID=110093 RepID=UPI0022FE2DF8|nr:HAD-like domain-containing protein [Polychytrium aggregatum]KAI9209394.1 HAD-like domain-containing protein [Polychytrium aggregatum]